MLALPSSRRLCAESAPQAVRLPTVASSGPSKRRRAKKPGQFEVITPPAKSLGVHDLAPDTHNGDVISVSGRDYIVDSLVIQFRLVAGRYQRSHHRLDVQSMSRYFTNLSLQKALTGPSAQKQ